MPDLKVIARYQDGRMVKGTTADFWPTAPHFHVTPVGGGPGEPIDVSRLKAVFIVKSFEGNANRTEATRPDQPINGHRLTVRFNDGETLHGTTMDYNPSGRGFFLFPVDPDSNNQRIFVVNSAVSDVRHG